MIRMDLEYNRLMAFIDQHPDTVRRDLVKRDVKKGQQQALSEWATRRGQRSLSHRFQPSAFRTLGLASRTDRYERRQRIWIGRVAPYVSPWRNKTNKMRNIMTLPGAGWRVRSPRGGDDVVRTQLKLPGAKVLNWFSGFDARYRREFLGFSAGGRGDAAWIERRAVRLGMDLISQRVSRARRRRKRADR